MQYLKTFSNGQSLSWQIEALDDMLGGSPQPVAYLDGERVGVIWGCMNLDEDGNSRPPQVVNGLTIVAYFKCGETVYCLVDHEFDAPRAARERAQKEKHAREAADWAKSSAGKTELARRIKEREWDEVNNEGGDGYNPYRLSDADATGTAFDRTERHDPPGS